MDFISENLKVIILAIVALFAGIAIRIIVKKGNRNKTIQKNNRVGGDQAGRDIKK